jgi:hypothetical protein
LLGGRCLVQADLSHSRPAARAAALIITGQSSGSEAYGSTTSRTRHSPRRLSRPNPEWPLRLEMTGRKRPVADIGRLRERSLGTARLCCLQRSLAPSEALDHRLATCLLMVRRRAAIALVRSDHLLRSAKRLKVQGIFCGNQRNEVLHRTLDVAHEIVVGSYPLDVVAVAEVVQDLQDAL